MRACKLVAAIAIAAMFIVLPIANAVASDAAEKSWVDGESAAYYKTDAINDVTELSKMADLDAMVITIAIGNIDPSGPINVTSVSDLKIEIGNDDSVSYPDQGTKIYENMSGTMEFNAVMASDGNFITEIIPSYYVGDMYSSINSYFGTLTKGQVISYSATFSVKAFLISSVEYKETKDAYALIGGTFHEKSSFDIDFTITIGDKSITYHESGSELSSFMNYTYSYDAELTPSTPTPSKCWYTLRNTADVSVEELYAMVDGVKHTETIDQSKVDDYVSSFDITDFELPAMSITSISPAVSFKDITNFSTDAEAKKYFDLKGYKYSDDYTEVDKIIEDAYNDVPPGPEPVDKKVWIDGEKAAYFKTDAVDDIKELRKMCDPESVAAIIAMGNVDAFNSLKVTDISNFKIEIAADDSASYPKQNTAWYQNASGTIEFTAKMAGDGKFITDTPSYYEGDMYSSINSYFGDLAKDQEVKYSASFSIKMFLMTSWEYKGVKDVYIPLSCSVNERIITSVDLTITIGEKKINYHESSVESDSVMNHTYKYDVELTSKTPAPSECLYTLKNECKMTAEEMYAVIDGVKHTETIDQDKLNEYAKSQDCTDKKLSYYPKTSEVSAKTDYTTITNFSTDAEAKNYFDTKGYDHSEDCAVVNKVIEDAYNNVKPTPEPEPVPSGKVNDNNVLLIILGILAGIAVVGTVVFFIIRR